MSEFRFFLHYALRHKYAYFCGIIALFATNLLAVSIPAHIGAGIDLLSSSMSKNYSQLLEHIYLVMIFAVVMVITRTLSRMLFFNPGRDVERELKNDAFGKLMHLQKSFYSRHQVGSLISIINNDISGVRAMAGVGTMQVFNIMFALSLTPLKMWQISPVLTLYCVVPVIVAFLIVNHSISYLRRLTRTRMLYLQTLSANTVNFLNAIEVIKNHHMRDWAMTEFTRDNQRLLALSLKQLRINTFVIPILSYTDGILKVLVISLGGLYLINGDLSLGELTAFLAYTTLLALPFISLGRIISTFQMGLVSLKSICRILDESVVAHADLDADKKQVLFSHSLRVNNLSFTYPSSDPAIINKPALKNISFEINNGQKIAIVGKVGSGKTTLVNCINRYLDVSGGQIFIDGIDSTLLSMSDLRSVVRTVTQDPFLFSDTVSNNIQFGSSARSDVLSMEDALYQSGMLAEVRQFPNAEETMVGEKGILLSGGQKQRLSLARAIYSPSKLIILDNVLSAVDNDTERFLLTHLFEQMRSQSCLIVSQRSAVLERVDQILLLQDGEIVARGTHHQLLVSSPIYRETWQSLKQEKQQSSAQNQEGES